MLQEPYSHYKAQQRKTLCKIATHLAAIPPLKAENKFRIRVLEARILTTHSTDRKKKVHYHVLIISTWNNRAYYQLFYKLE